MPNRRQFLRNAVLASFAASLPSMSRKALAQQSATASESLFEVLDVQRTTVRLEYRDVPQRSMDRELPHWRYTEFCHVTLKSGAVGTGETTIYYTWGATEDADVKSVIGKSALDVMWNDELGAGLQMALFDAVGRATGLPVHALLGEQVHQTTPLSWWNIDTPAADMASECKTAYELGYRSYKTKGRPWFDIDEQMKLSAAAVPKSFKIDMDFNNTLLDAQRGLPILERIGKYPQTDIYETPIPQGDVAGNRKICDATHVNVAMHYGTPSPKVVVQSGCCDGFVVGGGATKVMTAGHFCDQVEMPFWLQLVGSGLTAAWSLHFGGALAQARWPAVNCHQLYEHDLLASPIRLTEGMAKVPDRPGLGYELDQDVLAKVKVEKPRSRPEPHRLIETVWADGSKMLTASNGRVNFMLDAANREAYPYYKAGAHSQLVPDDGSAKWRELYQRARKSGPMKV